MTNPRDTFSLAEVSWVNDEESLTFLEGSIRTAQEVVFDLETTGLNEHAVTRGVANGGVAARVVLASYTLPQPDEAYSPTTYILPLSHPESPWQGRWKEILRQVSKAMVGTRVVGHNVKFDCRWVYATTGVDLSDSIWWDTQISSHLLDENESTKLKERVPATFGVDRWDDVDLNTPGAAERETLFKLGEYAARDTYWTWRLYFNHQFRMIPEPGEYPEDVQEARLGLLAKNCAMPTTATLTAIEQRGLGIDVAEVERMIEAEEKAASEAYAWLVGRYSELDLDRASFAPTSLWFQKWAEVAVDRGDLVVTALTPRGKPKWSKEVLTRLARQGYETAQKLLDHKRSTKRLEFLKGWLVQKSPNDRIYSTYHAGSVVTGRLSSSSPNMQQVAKELRPAFVPSEGYYLADLDYSQIELRVAAFISRCEPMIQAFKRGDDLHTLLAARINSKSPEDVTPQERQAGKSANFGLLYGMGAYGFREYADTVYGVRFTESEARAVHEAFFQMWDGIRQWHISSMAKVQRDGHVWSPIGRIRRLEHLAFSDDEKMQSFAERAGINSPVQGFASDIMQIASACIEGKMEGIDRVPGARIVGTVHDSILVEVPIETWEETTRACQQVMETTVPVVLERMDCFFDVPLKADAVVGTRWGYEDVGEL